MHKELVGIAGVVGRDPCPKVVQERLPTASRFARLSPDGRACFVHESPAASSSGLGSVQLAFDGRIYNHDALRRELGELGHEFRSDDDAELVIRGYAQWGEDVLRRLNGVWAFALYDTDSRNAFCARDRLGVRPFYWLDRDERFHFSSEIRPLLQLSRTRASPHRQRVCDFLTHGGMFAEDEHETFFEGVRKLPPGCCMQVDAGGMKVRRWWDPEPGRSHDNLRDPAARLRELLDDAVRLRVECAAPCVVAASGGLDSSAALFLSLPYTPLTPSTISLCQTVPLFDEREFITLAVRESRSRGTFVHPTAERMTADLPELWRAHEEPLPSPSSYGHFLLIKEAAARGFKNIVFGHGLDEIAAGYPEHYSFHLADLRLAGKDDEFEREIEFWKTLYWGTNELYEDFFLNHVTPSGTWNRAGHAAGIEAACELLTPDFAALCREIPDFPRPYPTLLKNALYRDLRFTSLPTLLRIEAAHCRELGVESHAPFLDHRVVEFIMSLPGECLISEGQPKWIVRRALEGVLPEPLRCRVNKTGLNVPLQQWYKEALGAALRKELDSGMPASLGIFDTEKLRAVASRPNLDQLTLIWRAVAVSSWYVHFAEAGSTSW
ncbi:MAG: asparagine synthase-related protein [Acidobacteriota bacterium]